MDCTRHALAPFSGTTSSNSKLLPTLVFRSKDGGRYVPSDGERSSDFQVVHRGDFAMWDLNSGTKVRGMVGYIAASEKCPLKGWRSARRLY